MSEEGKVNENDSEPLLLQTSSNSKTDETLAKLEDHRCAICQNIIINACRIDCGHTFCRHCVNIDRENKNSGGKSTCFICDAAVTEMTHNTERDIEIDDIYATLPTKERLARARAKAERAVEEESFNKRPRETNSMNPSLQHDSEEISSGESFGSGDASNSIRGTSNVAADAANTCHWDNVSHDHNDDAASLPTFYGGHGHFRVWRNDNYYNFPHEHSGESHNDRNEPDINTMTRDTYNRPPVVIHHTIHHNVYHTMEVRNTTGESEPESRESNSSLRHRSSQLSMDGRRCNNNNNSSRIPTAFHGSPSLWLEPQRETCAYDMPHQNQRSPSHPPAMFCHNRSMNSSHNYYHHPHYGFQFNHPITYASTAPCFLGFYPSYMSENRSTINHSCYHQNTQNYSHSPSEQQRHTAPFDYEPSEPSFQRGTERESESNYDEDYLNLDEAQDERYCGDEGLCEFHRAVRNHSSSDSMQCSRCSLEERTRSYDDGLSPHSVSNNAFHVIRDPSVELGQGDEGLEDDSDDDDDDDDEDGDPVITFRISVPMPNVQEHEESMIQGCRSSPEFVEPRGVRGCMRDSL